MTTCTYCGDSGVERSREDVFPRWLCTKLAYFAGRHHPGSVASYEDYSYANLERFRNDEPDSNRVVGEIPTAFHLPDVCRKCNEGWMSRLEESMPRVIAGVLEGMPKDLAPYDQALLGMWAVKTSLNYDAARVPRLVPAEVGTEVLYRLGAALPNSQVWVAHDPNHTSDGSIAHGRLPLTGPGIMAVRVALQFNQMILTTDIDCGSSADRVARFTPPARSRQVWPVQERFEWPSLEALRPRT
jgi:hypothetical protein